MLCKKNASYNTSKYQIYPEVKIPLALIALVHQLAQSIDYLDDFLHAIGIVRALGDDFRMMGQIVQGKLSYIRYIDKDTT